MGIKISAVVITYNEEENIRECLTALQRVSDEIIVVDTFSKDATPEICRSMSGVTFIQREWKGFSAQKNEGIALAKNNFILSVDGDEVLSEELIRSINSIDAQSEFNAYSFNILTHFRHVPIRHCGWYPGTKVRLWDSRLGLWEGAVHETIKFTSEVKCKQLEGDLLHNSIPTFDVFIEKVERYSTIFADDAFKRGKKVSLLRIVVGPLYTFIRMYIFRLGFLDGIAGYQVCRIMAFLHFVKYSKLRAMNQKNYQWKQVF